MMIQFRTLLCASCAVFALTSPNIAFAQTETEPNLIEEESYDDDEIVVTSTKRSQSAQSLPLAIAVLGGENLEAQGTTSLMQVENLLPGVNLAKGPLSSGVAVTVRGLGTSSGVTSFDSSVGQFVNGFYVSRNREFSSGQFDIERIEVVRGTQAAVLGKNTSLGAINVITRQPGSTFAVDARASYEFEQQSTLLSAGMDIPLAQNLALRVAGQFSNEGAFVENTIGRDGLAIRDRAIRAVLVWTPSSDLKITAFAQHGKTRFIGSPVEQISTNANTLALQAAAGFPGTIDARLNRHNAMLLDPNGDVPGERLAVDRYTLTADWDLGPAILTSATSYATYEDFAVGDADLLAGRYAIRTEDEKSKQFSQEVRIVSKGDTALQYLGGLLFIDNDFDFSTQLDFTYPVLRGSFITTYRQKTPTYSAFGQLTYRVVDGLRLIGGLRYTSEKKTADFERRTLTPGPAIGVYPAYAPFRLTRSEKNVDYSVGAQVDIADSIMAYASYGQGTKGGGYAPTVSRLETSEYLKETARTAEIGIKAQNRAAGWLFNVGLFETKVNGFQVVTFTGTQFLVRNANLRSRGVEVEGSWRVSPNFRLFANGTYAPARDRVTGNPIPLAPKFQGSANFNIELPLSQSLNLLVDGSLNHRSSRTSQQNPLAVPRSPKFTTVNVSLAVAAQDDAWEVRLIGRNLTNENSINFAFGTPNVGPGAVSAVPERPRNLALQLSGRF